MQFKNDYCNQISDIESFSYTKLTEDSLDQIDDNIENLAEKYRIKILTFQAYLRDDIIKPNSKFFNLSHEKLFELANKQEKILNPEFFSK